MNNGSVLAEEKISLEERILLAFARDPKEPEIGATASYTIDNCLDYAKLTIPGFGDLIRGKTILDYGCGPGFQAVAMRVKCGAKRVVGVDIEEHWFPSARSMAADQNCASDVTFGVRPPAELEGKFDLVISLSAFEHFADPAGELRRMRKQILPGGKIIISWAEPWFSHSGSHFNNYTKLPGTNFPLPWINLFFSDKALLTLRSRFRPDRPSRLEDIAGGLNRMTVARFERIIQESGLQLERLQLRATKNLPLVTKLPVLRELLTSSASCVLVDASPA